MSLAEETETEFIDEDVKLCVKRGAAWLDETDPEWVQKIKLETLRMSDGGQCILGQTYGHYISALDTIADDDRMEWAAEHGFNLTEDQLDLGSITGNRANYLKLGLAWAEYIKNRRAK